jgi:hypothetical protein
MHSDGVVYGNVVEVVVEVEGAVEPPEIQRLTEDP